MPLCGDLVLNVFVGSSKCIFWSFKKLMLSFSDWETTSWLQAAQMNMNSDRKFTFFFEE